MQMILQGYLVSAGFIGGVFVLSYILYKLFDNREYARKCTHILLGAWPFIGFYYFPTIWTLLSIPIAFVFVNYFSAKKHLFVFMERPDSGLGTVWYTISLVVLMIIGYVSGHHFITYIGILALALGDGFAAVVGTRFVSRNMKIGTVTFAKSVLGSLTVFLITTVIVFYFYPVANVLVLLLVALTLGFVAMLLELFSTNGYDNLFIPFGVASVLLSMEQGSILAGLVIALFTIVLLVGAFAKKALQINAVSVAFIVGVLLYTLGGLALYSALIIFFIIGSILSRITNDEKAKAEELHAESGTRGVMQVLMNSVPALTAVLAAKLLGLPDATTTLMGLSAFAVSTADTCASEIGMLSRGKTYSIITCKEVQRGMSGGVSVLGLIASVVGATIIGGIAGILYGVQAFVFVLIIGILGALIDSLLGETVQVKYQLEGQKFTERAQVATLQRVRARGIPFVDNNIVNILSNFCAIFIAFACYFIF